MNAEQLTKLVKDANVAAKENDSNPKIVSALIISDSNYALVNVSKRNADVIAKALNQVAGALDQIAANMPSGH